MPRTRQSLSVWQRTACIVRLAFGWPFPALQAPSGYTCLLYRATLTPQFALWVQCFPQVTLIPENPAGAMQWNCKPQALKLLLCGLVGIRVGLSETFLLAWQTAPRTLSVREHAEAIRGGSILLRLR